jgi:signal transduction histidine kinase
MSGNRGIFKVSRAELDAFAEGKRSSITSISYGVPDGMAVSETNGGGEPTCWKARDGKLWFAMIRGVVMIDPDRINTFPPPVTIEQVILDGQTLPPEQTIRVEPGQRNLEIRYAGLSFSRPEQVKFKYKLTGLDKSWVDAGTRRAAYFPHLPPGSYIFQVMAENGDGIWNTQGTSLRIDVIPPFWRTGWFIALGLLLVAATGTLAHRFHVMRLVKTAKAREMFSRQLLEAQERERKRIAAELHDGLGQSLLIIKNRALLAAGAVDDPETAKEQMDEISAASSHAVEEVREICYNLRPYQLDRFGLTKTLQSICQRASRTSGIDFHVDLDSLDGLFSQEAEASIYRIIQEGVNNTIKHSQATEADLLIRKRNDEVEIRIRDNGRGFISAAATTTPQISPGFGLIGVAERVRMLGGTRVIESSPGSGTLITIKLPISRNSYES